MPPRRKKKTVQQYVYVDSPEIRNLARGFARQNYHYAGYQEALVEANHVAARALAAKPGDARAKSAYMIGTPASGGGKFIIPATASEVINNLKLANRSVLNKAFKAGTLPPDPEFPGLVQSIIRGTAVMKSYHLEEDPLEEDPLDDRPTIEIGESDIDDIFKEVMRKS